MRAKDPETGETHDVNLDYDLLEQMQDHLANTPPDQMNRNRILKAGIKVHVDGGCPFDFNPRDGAYLELVVAHFLGWSLCAWCGEKLESEKGSAGISHGVCADCEAKMEVNADALFDSEARDKAE
ncbi:MAG: hypothetical protein GY838_12895 [bacterium]|nr:hypothetical protein [bacterium]